MSLFRLANELVRLVLRHLAAPDHELDEIASALDGEPGDSSRRANDILHGRRDLAPGLLADDLRTLGELGDRITGVRPAHAARA